MASGRASIAGGSVAERLAGFSPTPGAALLVVHGAGVTDRFVGPDFAVQELDAALWNILVADGFDRVVFNVPNWPIYFLDDHSRELSRRTQQSVERKPARRQMSRLRGPLGRLMLAPEPNSAPPLRSVDGRSSASLSDEAATTMFGALLGDPAVRTALIALDAEHLLQHTSAVRSLAVTMARLLDRPTGANLLVLVFRHVTFDDVLAFVADLGTYPGLSAHLSRLVDRPGQVVSVGPPAMAELERLTHRVRLSDGLSLSFAELPTLARTMASSRVPLRTWDARVTAVAREGLALTPRLVRERNWVEATQLGDADAWQQLNNLTGLAGVKDHLRRMQVRLEGQEALREKGRGTGEQRDSLHLLFMGNPGTGKSTVAAMIGELYRDLGLLSSGHLVAAKASDLIGAFEGQTAPAVHRLIQRARGGVLLIDEAYQLIGRSDGFGQEAVNALVHDLDALRDELAVIAVLYTDRVTEFLSLNPGLPSRFPKRNRIEFPDYQPDELLAILLGMLRGRGLAWTAEAEQALGEITTGLHAGRAKEFGNAREMRALAEEIAEAWFEQVGADVDQPLVPAHLPPTLRNLLADRDVPSVEELLRPLNALVGLDQVKQAIRDLVLQILLQKRRAAAGLRSSTVVAPHMLFVGPPGTGKTTVARLTGELLRAMGLLRGGQFVEASRGELVAGWLGQTEAKTQAVLDRARGGVLFIDEAYSLASDTGGDSFGQQAVATLVKEMEDARGRLVVIAAGYPDLMDSFLASNDGLSSRFELRVEFPDYTVPEMLEMLRRLAAEHDYLLTPKTLERAAAWLTEERRRSPRGQFGNGRVVRTFFVRLTGPLSERVGAAGPDQEVDLRTIRPEDVPDVGT